MVCLDNAAVKDNVIVKTHFSEKIARYLCHLQELKDLSINVFGV